MVLVVVMIMMMFGIPVAAMKTLMVSMLKSMVVETVVAIGEDGDDDDDDDNDNDDDDDGDDDDVDDDADHCCAEVAHVVDVDVVVSMFELMVLFARLLLQVVAISTVTCVIVLTTMTLTLSTMTLMPMTNDDCNHD